MNILLEIYKDGATINFERFTYKRLATVLKKYQELYNGGNYTGLWEMFFRDYLKADRIVAYATPDHYNKGDVLAEYTSAEFIAAIS